MKMFFLEAEDLEKVRNLFNLRQDGAFYQIRSANGYSDIVQYSQKYQNVHFVTVPTNKLNFNDCLGYYGKTY